MKRLLTFLTVLLCLPAMSMALEIKGMVTDKDGEPLISVSVITDITGVGTMTDLDGEFYLKCDNAVQRVTFSSVGFKSRQFKVNNLPEVIVLEPLYYKGSDIIVHASRVGSETAVAFENFSREKINRDYTVSEFPLLLETTPNLYSYAEAGSPLGAASVRIRGFDDKRVVTYINGVPLNDPEDQSTYFVDLPDFAANISDIQVQRGVGNSLYGDASFGGAINVITNTLNEQRQVVLTTGYGQYTSDGESVSGIYKQSVEYTSGLIDGRWSFGGRFSKQKSSGYRYNSWYDGWSYYFTLARLDPRMTTEINIYGGPIRYHAAWYGHTREEIEQDRRTNSGIAGYEDLTYENASDNFNQPHYQLHNTYKINERATLSNTLYYIRGKGYYEQLKPSQDYLEYNIDTAFTGGVESGDLVRQKWVVKKQIGWNPRLDIEHDKGSHSVGGSFYYFDSDHWGQVIWAKNIIGSLDPRHKYYEHYGEKYVGSFYGQEYYKLTERLSTQLTAQVRYQRYELEQEPIGEYKGYAYDVNWFFFSPRIGFHYKATNELSLYGNFSITSRTPTDKAVYDADDAYEVPALEIKDSTMTSSGNYSYDFGDPTIESERLYDIEVGGEYKTSRYSLGINLFWMKFNNMIVADGGVTDGIENTLNIDGAFHSGIELTAAFRLYDYLSIGGNFSYNYNRITDFIQEITYDFDTTDAFGDPVEIEKSVKVDLDGNTISRFPEYLGNLVVDYNNNNLRLTWRGRFIGRQYADLQNIKELSIDPVFVASISASYGIDNILGQGRLILTGKIDNLFDKEYESAIAYAENYAYRSPNETAVVDGWSTYFVAPERSFYLQAQLEFF